MTVPYCICKCFDMRIPQYACVFFPYMGDTNFYSELCVNASSIDTKTVKSLRSSDWDQRLWKYHENVDFRKKLGKTVFCGDFVWQIQKFQTFKKQNSAARLF